MNNDMVPYFVMEGVIDRQSQTIKRLWILCIILVVLLVGSNAGWLWYESQFEETTTTQEVEQEIDSRDGDGDITVIGIGGMYGESETDGENYDQE